MYGDPYGASIYLGVSSIPFDISISGCPFPVICPPMPNPNPKALAMARGLPNGELFLREMPGSSPKMGSLTSKGDPGNGDGTLPPLRLADETTRVKPFVMLLALTLMDFESSPGWLYIQVAMSTVDEPITKPGEMLKSNNATEARKERTMDRDVAKPLRILSEYLITIAVTRPPKT